jgi:FmdE, Molybdenum formylmethanofuran dehydrogenase operon
MTSSLSLLLARPPRSTPLHRSSLAGLAALLISASTGCGGAAQQETPHHAEGHHPGGHHAEPGSPKSVDEQLIEVERIHGGAGPWAVAGYRMGAYALAKLGVPRGSFDLEIFHKSPRQVQLSCIADGAAAATGASLGKLNLTLVDADEAHLLTTYRLKSTGASLSLRPSPAFVKRFRDLPREQLPTAGRIVISLPDAEVFEVVESPESTP